MIFLNTLYCIISHLVSLKLTMPVLHGEKRDKAAAQAFFRTARTVTGSIPERVTTDGHDA